VHANNINNTVVRWSEQWFSQLPKW